MDTMSCITKVRQGVMQDLPAIYNLIIKELLPSNGRSKLSLEDFRKFGFGDERLFHSFVAEVPGPRETGRHRPVELPAEKRIVGCVLYSMAFDYQVGRQVYLQGLAVNPDFQRKCVATALVEASLEAGRVAGCSEGTALIYRDNDRSRAFFKLRFGATDHTLEHDWCMLSMPIHHQHSSLSHQ